MCSMISKENTRSIKDKSILKHEFFTGMIWVVLTCEKKTQIQKDLDTSNQRVPWWKLVLQTFQLIIYLDLPKGPKWFLKGVKSPSLRVWLLGRCWYQLLFSVHCFLDMDQLSTLPCLSHQKIFRREEISNSRLPIMWLLSVDGPVPVWGYPGYDSLNGFVNLWVSFCKEMKVLEDCGFSTNVIPQKVAWEWWMNSPQKFSLFLENFAKCFATFEKSVCFHNTPWIETNNRNRNKPLEELFQMFGFPPSIGTRVQLLFGVVAFHKIGPWGRFFFLLDFLGMFFCC